MRLLPAAFLAATACPLQAADTPASQAPAPAVAGNPSSGPCQKPAGEPAAQRFPDVPDGDIFGFTTPTDVGSPGDCEIAFEFTGRAGKAGGRYLGGTIKTQHGATVAENLWIGVAPHLTFHRIRGVGGLDDRERARFDGLSGELIYRFVERSAANRVSAAFAVEPRWSRIEGSTGEAATAYSAEFKLLLDAVIIADRLYGAFNLVYEPAVQKSDNDPARAWSRSSNTSLSTALTYQINARLFAGAELRHLAAFDGAVLDRNIGRALFAGPTLMVKLSESAALNLVWTPQLRGRSAASARRFDLDNFERHQFRVKLTTSF